jgi:hypothetical protein
MTTIIEILSGLVGLFVDDELLAVGVLGIVGLTALTTTIGREPLLAGALLLCGSLRVLVLGAIRTARHKSRA